MRRSSERRKLVRTVHLTFYFNVYAFTSEAERKRSRIAAAAAGQAAMTQRAE